MEIIQDFLGEVNVITRVLTTGREEDWRTRRFKGREKGWTLKVEEGAMGHGMKVSFRRRKKQGN